MISDTFKKGFIHVKKYLWGIIFLLTICLSACKESPEEEIVRGKTAYGEYETESSATEKDTLEFSTKEVELTFSGNDSKVDIHVDASIQEPRGTVKTIRVKPHVFSSEEVRAIAEMFFNVDEMYEPKIKLTKRELEENILKLKEIISNETYLEEYYEGDQAAIEYAKQVYTKQIQEYEMKYEHAPDVDEIKLCDWEFHPRAYYSDQELDDIDDEDLLQEYLVDTLIAESNSNDYKYLLQARNNTNGGEEIHSFDMFISNDESGYKWDYSKTIPMTMGKDEVVRQAEQLLKDLNLPDMELVSCNEYTIRKVNQTTHCIPLAEEPNGDIFEYRLLFTPKYSDLSLLQYENVSTENVYQDETYGAIYGYEKLRLIVREDRIVSFFWDSPLEQVETELENVKILPFSKIMDLFQTQMQIEYTLGKISRVSPEDRFYNDIVSSIKAGRIDIDKINFGYTRIQIPDNFSEFLLVPAWCFNGKESVDYGSGLEDSGLSGDLGMTYQIVNAADGTIINGYLGY